MANPEHLAMLEQGVAQWNRWRQQHPEQRSAKIEESCRDGNMAGVSVIWHDPAALQGLGSLYIYWGDTDNYVFVNSERFSPPDLRGADLAGAVLHGADLSGVNFYRADLHAADLSRANFQFANLRQAELTAADLTEADLTKADLLNANLHGARIDGTKMTWTMLAYVNFDQAEIRAVDLGTAHLQGAKLAKVNLSGLNLSGSVLKEADLTGANVWHCDLSRAQVGGTIFADLDLSSVRGLEKVQHWGPSSIGVDTIYKSRGEIPEVFLRGCGVPDEVIELARSIGRNPTEYYSCFISYSTKGQTFADRLYADLQAKGVRCWFAPHDIMGGRKIHEQIDEAIRLHDNLLLILSAHSMASDWVGTEISKARKREVQENKRMLFPITIAPFDRVQEWELFDADRGKDSAREIREYYVPDFSGWQRDHAAYQQEFEKLVGALKNSGQ